VACVNDVDAPSGIDALLSWIVEHQEVNARQSVTALSPTLGAAGSAIRGAKNSLAKRRDGMLRIERIHCNGTGIASSTIQPRTPRTVRPMNAHAQILGCAVRIEIICRAGSSDADLPKQNRGKRSVSEEAGAAYVEQR